MLQARERNWISVEVARLEETQVEKEDLSYKSSQPNSRFDPSLRPAEVEKHVKRIYTYTFRTGEKQYVGRCEKKPVQGLGQGMRVGIIVQRGWLIIHMPDGKEKRIDFLE